jgi:nucleotide-binding universal stress UspA family protein
MHFKDILVHLDDSPSSAARIEIALALAVEHGARLVGLRIDPVTIMPPWLADQIPDEILDRQTAAQRLAGVTAEKSFAEMVRQAGVTGEWRHQWEREIIPLLTRRAHCADLVIVGQRDPSGEEGCDEPKLPDQLILGAGRPVLVIPYAGQFLPPGRRILVAWDGSRLASRAVHDALPLLARAKHVVVLAVNSTPGRSFSWAEEGTACAEICRHLARHGIHAEPQQIDADDISVGAMLLSRAAEQGVDLIVSGAYGHARWRELVLGSVTRHLLRHAIVPTLMSH